MKIVKLRYLFFQYNIEIINLYIITFYLTFTIKIFFKQIWNIKTGICEATLAGHDGAICALQFKNNTLVTGSVDTTIKIW